MLTDIERIIFIVLSLFALGAAGFVARRIYLIIRRGQGALGTDHWERRLRRGLGVFLTQRTVLKRRPLASIFHTMIAWGFTFYLLVNVVDVAVAWFAELRRRSSTTRSAMRISCWPICLTMGVLVGMVAMLIRRVYEGQKIFGFNKNTSCCIPKPRSASSATRPSSACSSCSTSARAIWDRACAVALAGRRSVAALCDVGQQPVGRACRSRRWKCLEHVFFWGAIGSIMLFIPYFLISKHIHLMMGPRQLRAEACAPIDGRTRQDQLRG